MQLFAGDFPRRGRPPSARARQCASGPGVAPRGGARETAVEARARGPIGAHEEGYWLDVPADGSRAVLGAVLV